MRVNYFLSASVLLLASACGKKTEETSPIRKNVITTVFASGILEAKNTYSLVAQTDGYLVSIRFEEGDIVSKGDVLAIVDNKENLFNRESADQLLEIARSNTNSNAPALLQAKTTIELNEKKMNQEFAQLQRYKKLYVTNSVAKIDVENSELQYQSSKAAYETAKENYNILVQQATQQEISSKAVQAINATVLSRNLVKAVVRGKVFKKYKQVGDYIKKGETIALLGSDNNIYAKVNVDETNIAKIKIGQEAVIQLNTKSTKTYKGVVSEIYPSFDEASQSFFCKIQFLDSLDFTIVNTQLQCNVITDTRKNALLIPRNYLDFGGFIQVKGEKEKRKITTGFVSGDWVEVLSGIKDKDILITDNITANKVATSEVGASLQR